MVTVVFEVSVGAKVSVGVKGDMRRGRGERGRLLFKLHGRVMALLSTSNGGVPMAAMVPAGGVKIPRRKLFPSLQGQSLGALCDVFAFLASQLRLKPMKDQHVIQEGAG